MLIVVKVHLKKLSEELVLFSLYTGMVYKGPEYSLKISSELIDILKNKGFKNISEAVGSKKLNLTH